MTNFKEKKLKEFDEKRKEYKKHFPTKEIPNDSVFFKSFLSDCLDEQDMAKDVYWSKSNKKLRKELMKQRAEFVEDLRLYSLDLKSLDDLFSKYEDKQ